VKPAPLAADERAREGLQRRLKDLVLPPQGGSASAPSAAKVLGKKYAFPTNDQKLESVALEGGEKEGEVTLIARFNGAEQRIVCGRGAWRKGRGAWGRFAAQPVAASGGWTGDDTFTAKLCFYETPFLVTARLKFSGDEVRCEAESNVGFWPLKQAPLVGKSR
jgi:hypothetical protein